MAVAEYFCRKDAGRRPKGGTQYASHIEIRRCRYFLLDFDSATSGINRAGKLNESGISGCINDAAAMFLRL
jgi:hypothetical protein